MSLYPYACLFKVLILLFVPSAFPLVMKYLKENYPDEFNDCLSYWCANREKFDLFIAKVKERCPINQLKHFIEIFEIEELEQSSL